MSLPLINKQDNFEVIRDQIASILVLETANQMQLATDAGLDPQDWKLRVFTERSNPWEQWLNGHADQSPIINVWYDNSSFDKKSSNISERQTSNSTFNIDCYGHGLSANNPSGGHHAGDALAGIAAGKAARLVRNILMASENTYLQLRGLVGQRWPQSIATFQPQIDGQQVQHVMAARIALQVKFNEFSPQYEAETLSYLSIDVKRVEDGEIVLEADYDYTAT